LQKVTVVLKLDPQQLDHRHSSVREICLVGCNGSEVDFSSTVSVVSGSVHGTLIASVKVVEVAPKE
jgi:hypothetical protein